MVRYKAIPARPNKCFHTSVIHVGANKKQASTVEKHIETHIASTFMTWCICQYTICRCLIKKLLEGKSNIFQNSHSDNLFKPLDVSDVNMKYFTRSFNSNRIQSLFSIGTCHYKTFDSLIECRKGNVMQGKTSSNYHKVLATVDLQR